MNDDESDKPAFPQHASTGNMEDWRHGMDLRDAFACAVVTGIAMGGFGVDAIAIRAYGVADAMLRVRLERK